MGRDRGSGVTRGRGEGDMVVGGMKEGSIRGTSTQSVLRESWSGGGEESVREKISSSKTT
jgi:hypothetical protein